MQQYKQKQHGIEEEANLIYADKLVENLGQSNVSLADVVSQLQTEGYNINAVSNDGNTITGISLNTNTTIRIIKPTKPMV